MHQAKIPEMAKKEKEKEKENLKDNLQQDCGVDLCFVILCVPRIFVRVLQTKMQQGSV